MRGPARTIWAATIVGGLVAGAAPARGFECTTTDLNDFVSIRWLSMPVRYALRTPDSKTLRAAEVLGGIQHAFAQWATPRCTHVRFEEQPTVTASTPLTEVSQIIFVQSSWPHDSSAVALTTMTYSTIDGTISYGKIEMNEAGYKFIDAEAAASQCMDMATHFDFAAVLTHEVGHFIGLAHVKPESGVPTEGDDAATMSARANGCDSGFRTLERDDVEGVCFIYPSGQRARACDDLPPQSEPYVKSLPLSCATSSGDAGGSALVVGLLLLAWRRRARAGLALPSGPRDNPPHMQTVSASAARAPGGGGTCPPCSAIR